MKAKGYTKETILNEGVSHTLPDFKAGDTVAVHQKVKERVKDKKDGKWVLKERIQVFQGDVLSVKKNGASSTFTVRKIGAHGIPVERIIPFNSPLIHEIKVVKRGDVRRSKLYYVRDRVGNAAKLKEKRDSKDSEAVVKVPVQATKPAAQTEAAK